MTKFISLILLLILSVIISIVTMIYGWNLTIENGWIVTGGYAWIFIHSFIVNLITND